MFQKKGMNIEGLGIKILEQLVDKGFVKNIADIYTLTVDDVASLKKNGRKNLHKNVIDAINRSKDNDLLPINNSIRNKGT